MVHAISCGKGGVLFWDVLLAFLVSFCFSFFSWWWRVPVPYHEPWHGDGICMKCDRSQTRGWSARIWNVETLWWDILALLCFLTFVWWCMIAWQRKWGDTLIIEILQTHGGQGMPHRNSSDRCLELWHLDASSNFGGQSMPHHTPITTVSSCDIWTFLQTLLP